MRPADEVGFAEAVVGDPTLAEGEVAEVAVGGEGLQELAHALLLVEPPVVGEGCDLLGRRPAQHGQRDHRIAAPQPDQHGVTRGERELLALERSSKESVEDQLAALSAAGIRVRRLQVIAFGISGLIVGSAASRPSTASGVEGMFAPSETAPSEFLLNSPSS